MRLLIVGIVALALAVAGVSTYLIQSFGGEENLEELQKQAQKPQFRVLVAARVLRPGEVLMPEGMSWLKWSEEAMNPQFVAAATDDEAAKKAKNFEGGVIRMLVNQGEPILASKIFKTGKSGFLAGILDGGMRAVSLQASPQTAASGFIIPGDRVDILMTHDKLAKVMRKKGGGKKKKSKSPLKVISDTTETIMKDVRVIAVNQLIDLVEGQSIPATTITLEVTPKQAELLVTARKMGKLTMVLRSLKTPDALTGKDDPKRPSYTTDVEVSGVLSNLDAILNEEEEEKADSKTTAKPAAKRSVMKIYRGGAGSTEEIRIKQ